MAKSYIPTDKYILYVFPANNFLNDHKYAVKFGGELRAALQNRKICNSVVLT